tara:strand:- start:1421 stop:1636 length:216 start_codon:yes stop_codon:yes gene_type:complete
MKRGDLVHLPSQTFLYDSHSLHSDYKKLQKPGVGIVLEEVNNYVKLSFDNNVWYVARKDTFLIEKGEKSDS